MDGRRPSISARIAHRNESPRRVIVSTLDRSIPLPGVLSQNNLRDESLMGCERCGLVDEDLIEGDLDDVTRLCQSLHVYAILIADDGDQFRPTLNAGIVKIQ